MLLRGIIPYLGNIVNKKSQRRRFRRRFYVLTLIQNAGRGIRYLSAFPAASPWRPFSRRQAPTPRKPPPAFRFLSSISRKPARRASPFLSFRFPSRGFCALFPAPPRIPSINNSFLHTIIYRYYCPKNVMAGRTDFVTLPFPFCHLQTDILNTLQNARKKAPGGSVAKRFFITTISADFSTLLFFHSVRPKLHSRREAVSFHSRPPLG